MPKRKRPDQEGMDSIPSAKELIARNDSKIKGITVAQYETMKKGVEKLEKEMLDTNEFPGFTCVAYDHSTYTPAMIKYLDSLGYNVKYTSNYSCMADDTTYYTDISIKEEVKRGSKK